MDYFDMTASLPAQDPESLIAKALCPPRVGPYPKREVLSLLDAEILAMESTAKSLDKVRELLNLPRRVEL